MLTQRSFEFISAHEFVDVQQYGGKSLFLLMQQSFVDLEKLVYLSSKYKHRENYRRHHCDVKNSNSVEILRELLLSHLKEVEESGDKVKKVEDHKA